VAAPLLDKVLEAANKRVLYLPHALDAMNSPERLITPEEVREVLFHGEVIEDYPEDVRGHSCLLLGFGLDGRPIHVVCAPKVDYLAIITVYLPDHRKWDADYKRRRASHRGA
jgi:hypothetical protein